MQPEHAPSQPRDACAPTQKACGPKSQWNSRRWIQGRRDHRRDEPPVRQKSRRFPPGLDASPTDFAAPARSSGVSQPGLGLSQPGGPPGRLQRTRLDRQSDKSRAEQARPFTQSCRRPSTGNRQQLYGHHRLTRSQHPLQQRRVANWNNPTPTPRPTAGQQSREIALAYFFVSAGPSARPRVGHCCVDGRSTGRIARRASTMSDFSSRSVAYSRRRAFAEPHRAPSTPPA